MTHNIPLIYYRYGKRIPTNYLMAKILIVDDIQSNRELLTEMLSAEQCGYEFLEAADGEEALAVAKKHKPDIILLDVMIPKTNGFKVCARLKSAEDTRFIPIIIITSLTNFNDRIKGLEAGTDDFLSKPFHQEELITRVRSLLRMHQMHLQLQESHHIIHIQKEEIQKKNDLLSEILNRYMSAEVTDHILSNPAKYMKLGGEIRKITTLFADIRGFTAYSQNRVTPQQVVATLNTVFARLTEIVFQFRGTLDKFLGDGIMVFYGAPLSSDDDAFRSIQTAMSMQEAFSKVQQSLDDPLFYELGLGIGINTGDAIVGNIGSERTMDYTVIADSVNIASRLEGIAQKGEIIISENTYQEVSHRIIAEQLEPQKIKGISDKLTLFRVLKILA